MRVLLAALDIFRKSGGGESFYQALIARNPQIEFCCYTRSREELTQSVPANVRLIDLREPYRDRYHAFALQELQTPIDQLSLADEAERIAFVLDLAGSAARQNFDIVDIPDFLVQGWLLPFALRYFGAKIGKVVLSMHGTISDALFDNWAGEAVGDLSTLERTDLCSIAHATFATALASGIWPLGPRRNGCRRNCSVMDTCSITNGSLVGAIIARTRARRAPTWRLSAVRTAGRVRISFSICAPNCPRGRSVIFIFMGLGRRWRAGPRSMPLLQRRATGN